MDLNVVEAFLRWYLETHNVVSLDGFLVKVRYWRIYYCYTLDHEFPYTLKRETKNASVQPAPFHRVPANISSS